METLKRDFEVAMSATRDARYTTGLIGAAFGAFSGYAFAAANPHLSVLAALTYTVVSGTVYGLAFYGAATLATEMNLVIEAKNNV
jgi:hypothetical protein